MDSNNNYENNDNFISENEEELRATKPAGEFQLFVYYIRNYFNFTF